MKYFLYRLKWYLAKYINFNSPVHLDIELSTKCSLNCEFCFRKEYKYESKNIDAKFYFEILLQAFRLNIKSIKFNWRGEALENPDALHCFEITKIFGIYTMLNTALYMDHSDILLSSLAKNIDNLKVSFDSSSWKIYNEIRKGADFFQTLANLDKLVEYREQYKMPKIILNRRTSKLTESDEAFKDFFKDEVDYDIRPAMNRNQQQIYYEGLRDKERQYCGQPSRRMVVDVKGDCFMCCCAYAEPKELHLGNIKEKSLKELWDSPKRLQLIKELKQNIFNNDTCLNCVSGEAYL